jgi:hypothetical protein
MTTLIKLNGVKAFGKIAKDGSGEFYAMVVRKSPNGFGGDEEVVLSGFKPRYFKLESSATRAILNYLLKLEK